MRAISLHQPWASAMALGSKKIETRSWYTSVKGPVAIHAAKRFKRSEMEDLCSMDEWRGALGIEPRAHVNEIPSLPLGAIVAVGNLVDCIRTDVALLKRATTVKRGTPPFLWSEEDMGDFSPGRFAWVFEDIRALPKPVPFIGRQGYFWVPDELLQFKTEVNNVGF